MPRRSGPGDLRRTLTSSVATTSSCGPTPSASHRFHRRRIRLSRRAVRPAHDREPCTDNRTPVSGSSILSSSGIRGPSVATSGCRVGIRTRQLRRCLPGRDRRPVADSGQMSEQAGQSIRSSHWAPRPSDASSVANSYHWGHSMRGLILRPGGTTPIHLRGRPHALFVLHAGARLVVRTLAADRVGRRRGHESQTMALVVIGGVTCVGQQ